MRAADQYGVDLIQNCEVTGIRIEMGKAVGVDDTRFHWREENWACGCRQLVVWRMAGLRLRSRPCASGVRHGGLKPLLAA